MKIIALLITITGLTVTINASIIPMKAWLSQKLIDQAWNETIKTGINKKPWPWLDSTPIAKLSIPKHKWENVVLSGVSGEVMAFAPGWHKETTELGKKGVSLISAHKDTHFQILEKLKIGDKIILTTTNETINYKISDFIISDNASISIQKNTNKRILALSTCYPFSKLQQSNKNRFVAIMEEI